MPSGSEHPILVSVIVPVYNVESYVGECVASLLNQSLREIELIFIDDASTDASLSLVEAQTLGCAHVTILRHLRNEGVGAARNRGIEAARGEYLKIIDSDDVLDEHALEDLYREASEHDADIVFHDAVWWFADGSRSAYPHPERSRKVCRMRGHAAWWYLFRRSIVMDHPAVRFPIGAHPHEDTTFSFMLYTHCDRSRYLPKGYLIYRQHEGMVMKQVKTSKQEQNQRSAGVCVGALFEFYEALPASSRARRADAFIVLSKAFYRMAGSQMVSSKLRGHFRMRRVKRFLYQSKQTSSGRLLVKILSIPVFLWPLGSGKSR